MESRDRSEAASGTCQSKTIDDKETLRHIYETEADSVEAKSDEKAMNDQRRELVGMTGFEPATP